MGLTVTHPFHSAKTDSTDLTLVNPSNWNAIHTVVDTSKIVSVWDFNFASQTPLIPLTAGITNTILLSPVPAGINGTNTFHYVRISGGTGAAEAVLITGGTAVSGAASGTITFVPANNHSGAWTVTSGSDGMQEVIYYASIFAYAVVSKGWCFNQTGLAFSNINIYAPVYVPPMWGGHIEFGGINFTVLMGATVADAVTFDSMDFSYIDFFHCQIYWPSMPATASIWRFWPRNPNGEASTAITSSTISLPTTVPALNTGAPGILGNCVRFSALAPANVIAGNIICLKEGNGGKYGILVDTPTATNGFNSNQIIKFYIHGQATASLQLGTANVSSLLASNKWEGIIGGVGTDGVVSYGVNDTFLMNIVGGGGNGFNFKATSSRNNVISSSIQVGGSQWLNAGVANRISLSEVPLRSLPAVGASPDVHQNLTGRTITVCVNGTLTSVGISADGATYDTNATVATVSFYTLVPDMYIKLIYAGAAPTLVYYY